MFYGISYSVILLPFGPSNAYNFIYIKSIIPEKDSSSPIGIYVNSVLIPNLDLI